MQLVSVLLNTSLCTIGMSTIPRSVRRLGVSREKGDHLRPIHLSTNLWEVGTPQQSEVTGYMTDLKSKTQNTLSSMRLNTRKKYYFSSCLLKMPAVNLKATGTFLLLYEDMPRLRSYLLIMTLDNTTTSI